MGYLIRETTREERERIVEEAIVNRLNEKALRSYAVFGFLKVGECEMYDQSFYCFEKELTDDFR